MDKPRASIVVNTYNRSQILRERSLASALNQKFDDFEVVVVDDCSTDDTEAVVRELQKSHPNLRYIKQNPNQGLAAGRNVGARAAKGDYVVCLDDDDALDPQFLAETVPIMDTLPHEYGAIGCARIVIYPDGEMYAPPPKLTPTSFYTTIDDGFLIRKKVFNKISYDEELLTDEDADFGIQFLRHYKMYVIDKPLLLKYGHAIAAGKASKYFSFSFPSERRFTGLRKFLAKNLKVYIEKGDKRELAYLYRIAGRNFCWGGKMKEGIPYLWKACLTRPSPRNFLNLMAALLGPTVYRYYWALETKGVRFIRSRFLNRVRSKVRPQ